MITQNLSMIIPPSIGRATSLTHPSNYHPSPQVMEDLGSGAVLFAVHDQAILDHQSRLVERALEGSLSKETFLRNVGHLESFEVRRAELRGEGGLTNGERAELANEMKKLAGKMNALPHHQTEPSHPTDKQALGALYDDLRNGVVDAEEATEELHWRSNVKYGQIVADRPGVIYGDERPKLRASLATPSAPAAPSFLSEVRPEAVELVRKGLAVFPHLDANRDGLIDRAEARKLLTDSDSLNLTPAEAATLYSRQAILAEVVEPGAISHEQLSKRDLKALLPEHHGLAHPGRVAGALNLLDSRLADQNRRDLSHELPLYADPSGPNGSRVAQGLEGDCWLLGALPTLTSDEIRSLVTESEGGYQVHLADGTAEHVTPLSEAERRVYSRGDGAWSGLVEKAVAQRLGAVGLDLKGGRPQDALALLTGAECDVFSLVSRPASGPDLRDRAALGTLLQTTLESGGAVFTQANSVDYDPQQSLISDARHAYTVTGFDPESQTVSLRNPWGHGEKADRDGVDDGNFQMTLTEMAANMSLVITERV